MINKINITSQLNKEMPISIIAKGDTTYLTLLDNEKFGNDYIKNKSCIISREETIITIDMHSNEKDKMKYRELLMLRESQENMLYMLLMNTKLSPIDIMNSGVIHRKRLLYILHKWRKKEIYSASREKILEGEIVDLYSAIDKAIAIIKKHLGSTDEDLLEEMNDEQE